MSVFGVKQPFSLSGRVAQYDGLLKQGKEKKVAITACMRIFADHPERHDAGSGSVPGDGHGVKQIDFFLSQEDTKWFAVPPCGHRSADGGGAWTWLESSINSE